MSSADAKRGFTVLVFDTPTSPPRREVVTGEQATVGTAGTVKIAAVGALPIHARIVQSGGGWTVQAERDASVTINGVRARRPWILDGCDRIGVGDGALVFLPRAAELPIGSGAHGFSRAKHYVNESIKVDRSDRKLVKALARLAEAVNETERNSVLQRTIKLMNADEYTKAIAELDRVLAVSPRHARALLHKSMCLLRLARPEQARAMAIAARDAAADDPELRDEATEFLDKIRELGPPIAVNQAIKDMNAGRFWQAQQLLTTALSSFPGDAAILFHLAICQIKGGDTRAARASLASITGPVAPDLRAEIAKLRTQLMGAM